MLPAHRSFAGILVMEPAMLIASKVIAYHQRRGKPKAGTDWRDLALLFLKFPELKRDLALLFLKFPELKVESGSVLEQLQANGVDGAIVRLWQEIVETEIQAENEDDF
ncbi:MAG: hypothetical protein ACPGVO_15130 [Spirulinaceae cyanobacterium]